MAPALRAQRPAATEYQVKAAYLYNFGRFVEWPEKVEATREASFVICVLGQDPFGTALDATLDHQTVDGKRVLARRIAGPQEAPGCRILFISASEEKHLKDVLAALPAGSILTVSDIAGFSRRGGMIEFVIEGARVRFEVNLKIAEGAGLVLSSELLKVAAAVRNGGPNRN